VAVGVAVGVGVEYFIPSPCSCWSIQGGIVATGVGVIVGVGVGVSVGVTDTVGIGVTDTLGVGVGVGVGFVSGQNIIASKTIASPTMTNIAFLVKLSISYRPYLSLRYFIKSALSTQLNPF
jgi:hypothetical protein